MKVYKKLFPQIANPENLFLAWNEFYSDKKNKIDVLAFQKDLESHIFELSRDLRDKKYRHGKYMDFYISDPKRRHIYKAIVRDRVLHHAIFKILNPIFEKTFIPHSFSCRINKGTHKGVATAKRILLQVSRNHTHPCYVLKCDVQKFFDSINHETLISILQEKIKDINTIWLLKEIIGGYQTEPLTRERERERVKARSSAFTRL